MQVLHNFRNRKMPQHVRERTGSFFTPQIWVEKSQEYLEKVFGADWQDEYYIWDCCCGTGNLLVGLTNPDNVWASTIDQPDIDVAHTLIDSGFNLLKSNVFQFDFLNDEFVPQSKGGKIPDALFKIISHPEKRKKLIVYINPPYAEASSTRVMSKTGEHKTGVSDTKAKELYSGTLGKAANELFAHFFIRIFNKIPGGNLASFSKLKYLNAPNFVKFRRFFRAKYKGGFICKANTFDNVNGSFPIGFLIWELSQSGFPKKIQFDVLDNSGLKIGAKKISNSLTVLNEWITDKGTSGEESLGKLYYTSNETQHNKYVFINQIPSNSHLSCLELGSDNLIVGSVYFAVRHCIEHHWANDRDQFLCPNDGYKKDKRFQNDCLMFTLFHNQNRIVSQDGVNHWLPFTRKDVKARNSFASTFMSDFVQERGKFSKEAEAVFAAGKDLWTYYHATIKDDDNADVNASLYDIRAYFKGRKNGRVNSRSSDERFTELDKTLKDALKVLAEQIQPKVYEYGFLLE